MKTAFKYKNVHHCEAVVLTCIDFRLWKETAEFVEKGLRIDSFDFPSLPGAAKAINESQGEDSIALQCIDVPCSLHKVNKVVIVNHEDCGAYGGSGKFNGDKSAEQKFHESELKKAKEKLISRYPDKEYILVYARFDDKQENIEFVVCEEQVKG